ncbi:MAG: hypothetical protein ACJ8AO_05555 [Gemmatimonadaceae bacterium]
MPLSAAGLRFPYERTLLPRTKLAYVHLRNLLTDAKRDRAARVFGYVAIWLPEEFLMLYMQRGEVVNATTYDGRVFQAVAIAEALERVPTEPEFGEICFHEAPDEQLACMYAAQTTPPDEWPDEMNAADARRLFPYLMATTYDGLLEVAVQGSMNYLLMKDGVVNRAFLSDPSSEPAPRRVERLFSASQGALAPNVRRWPVPTGLPAQAPHGLIQAYRTLIHDLVLRLVASGSEGAPSVAEQARRQLLERFPALETFNLSGRGLHDPVCNTGTLSLAVATWIAEVLWSSGGAEEVVPEQLLAELTKERRHMYQSAGFYDALPWKVTW